LFHHQRITVPASETYCFHFHCTGKRRCLLCLVPLCVHARPAVRTELVDSLVNHDPNSTPSGAARLTLDTTYSTIRCNVELGTYSYTSANTPGSSLSACRSKEILRVVGYISTPLMRQDIHLPVAIETLSRLCLHSSLQSKGRLLYSCSYALPKLLVVAFGNKSCTTA
jgi:hypothetical protein